MTTKITYIADDGEEFETKAECLEYEKNKDASDCVLMFDENLNHLESEDSGAAYEKSVYFYILDSEKARKFFEWQSDNYGYCYPEKTVNGQLYYFNDEKQNYENMNEFIESLVKKRDYLLKKVNKLLEKEG